MKKQKSQINHRLLALSLLVITFTCYAGEKPRGEKQPGEKPSEISPMVELYCAYRPVIAAQMSPGIEDGQRLHDDYAQVRVEGLSILPKHVKYLEDVHKKYRSNVKALREFKKFVSEYILAYQEFYKKTNGDKKALGRFEVVAFAQNSSILNQARKHLIFAPAPKGTEPYEHQPKLPESQSMAGLGIENDGVFLVVDTPLKGNYGNVFIIRSKLSLNDGSIIGRTAGDMIVIDGEGDIVTEESVDDSKKQLLVEQDSLSFEAEVCRSVLTQEDEEGDVPHRGPASKPHMHDGSETDTVTPGLEQIFDLFKRHQNGGGEERPAIPMRERTNI
ncbi:MAG: hypothetical protein AB1540_11500 [Bdellovibrionota bacterium]